MIVTIDGVIFENQAAGGISRLFRELLPRVCEADPGVRMELVIRSGTDRDRLPAHPRIRTIEIPRAEMVLRPTRMWRPLLTPANALLQRLRLGGSRRRIWQSTYYTLPIFWGGPEIVMVYDLVHERFPEIFDSPADAGFRDRKRTCIERADAVVCISETTRGDVSQSYAVDPARVHVMPLAASELFFPSPGEGVERDAGGERPFLLYVGNRRGYKNFAALLTALAAWEDGSRLDLVAVGGEPAWSPEEEGLLATSDLASRVQLRGPVTDGELRGLYRSAAAFVQTSRYEGFGIPILEAMASGCPVVASRIPSTLEIAGECPEYFDPEDPESLRHALGTAIAGGRRRERVAAGEERARRYSWERSAAAFLGVCRGVGG